MNPNEFLKKQLILLLSAYGEKAVKASLAKILHLSTDELNIAVAELQLPPSFKTRSTGQQHDEKFIDELIKEYPLKADPLRRLYSNYVKKLFLPDLKDVRNFLALHKQNHLNIKSRQESQKKILKILAELPIGDLEKLIDNPIPRHSNSSLAIISDQILNKDTEIK